MSVSYKAVDWNAFKKRYDKVLICGLVFFFTAFITAGILLHPNLTIEILLMRASALAAILLLHLILAIGPLARINRMWIPLLYNRRHLGVTMFLLALTHSMLAILTYHVGGGVHPVVSVFTTDAGFRMSSFPFQAFGFAALVILFIMAATSHDFWLKNLTAPVWKTLHMGVYFAYALLIVHVAFGILQSETSPVYSLLLVSGVIAVSGLHLFSGWSQRNLDNDVSGNEENGEYIAVCPVSDLTENVPLGANIGGERVAILLYDRDKVSCVSGVCQHQNGPLAEGQFKFGCLTCPWHGYQYKPHDGTSPEPFTEKIPTFDIKIVNGEVLVRNRPNPPGTPVEAARITLN